MRLNKDVCKLCMTRDGRAPWNARDEEQWSRGEVLCPGAYLENINKPRIRCPYLLEHIVSEKERV